MSSMPKLVLVTGANGFAGGVLVKTLLEQGYKVRGTVRDVNDDTKTTELKALPNADANLELVSLQLTDDDPVFEQALDGVEWVMHVATVVTLRKQSNENAVIGPAVGGTRSMLRAAQRTRTVKKFILTSSISAVIAGLATPGATFATEDDWGDPDGPNVATYDKSKILAEQAAWNFMKEHPNLTFTLSVICPSWILVPPATSTVKSSTEIAARIMRGQDPGCVNIHLQIVDVRDVAQAHINAAKYDEAAGKRFIICQTDGGEIFMPKVAEILKKEFEPMGYTIRTRRIPTFIVWLISLYDTDVASIYPNVDVAISFNVSRSKSILKMKYRPVEETIIDGAHAMIDLGIIRKTQGYKKPSA